MVWKWRALAKKEIAEVLKTAPEHLKEVLSLRQQLAKSSVKKYQAMQNAACADNRARGCSNSMEPTAAVDGQEELYNCKISIVTLCRIWNLPVTL